MTTYSHEYQESWKCNFLGLSPDVSLSDHVTSSEMFVLVTIVRDPVDCDQSGVSSLGSLSGPESDVSEASGEEDVLLRDYVFRMSSPVCLPEKGEQLTLSVCLFCDVDCGLRIG